MTRRALIVGASLGIGLGLAEAYVAAGWQVAATRRTAPTDDALSALAAQPGAHLCILQVDVTRLEDIAALSDAHPEPLDLLLVNAGTGGQLSAESALEDIIVTNAVGPIRVLDALVDRVVAGGVVAVMTSRVGSVAANEQGGLDGYRASKAALNSLTRSFAARRRPHRYALLSLHPGWVRTDMGGPDAPVEVSESVAALVRVIADAAPGTHRFLDYLGREIPW